ncbi:hypothetical protein EGR_07213 [Echinococcus granulosus]|uniref:Uncharacterized protein n=1 Tax=Echinococcus granulosus TaxID=6210 RepID=W6U9A9_ECHGR|nr:hypothetical protein EGR_07213 [Echinococcus granulosus]EUB57943.1 hypothetical protein EGR_07213 [Echinococcus granulosus]
MHHPIQIQRSLLLLFNSVFILHPKTVLIFKSYFLEIISVIVFLNAEQRQLHRHRYLIGATSNYISQMKNMLNNNFLQWYKVNPGDKKQSEEFY